MSARRIEVSLDIPADRLMAYYRDGVQNVVARDREGRHVQFPVAALRPFVEHGGVRGRFVLRVDARNKLLGIERLDD